MPLSDSQKKAFDRLERAGYMPQMRRLARSLCAPFWWHGEDENGQYRIFHNGTVCFLETGSRVLAVTAEHVYSQYLQDKEKYSAFSAQIGDSTVEPEKYLIERNKEWDLATFCLPHVLLVATGANVHHPIRWPPDPIEEGEVVIFGGFPGILREEKNTTAEFPFVTFASEVTAASPQNIKLHLDLPNVHWPAEEKTRISDFGGASGGPIFRLIEKPIDRIELAGFIYEYSPSLDVMFARQGWRVRSDGSIHDL